MLTLVAAFAVAGCNQALGLSDRHVKEAPQASELIGAWHPSQASLAHLREQGLANSSPPDHKITLGQGGGCRFRSHPDYSPSGNALKEPESCTWSIARARAYIRHVEHDLPVVELRLQTGTHTTISRYYMTREEGALVLWQYIGDPDYERYIDFSRG